jgi:ketosteroid isomerase-like protein
MADEWFRVAFARFAPKSRFIASRDKGKERKMTLRGAGPREDKAAIDRVRERHTASMNAADAGAFVACCADDAGQMPPHFASNSGKAAIRGWIQGVLSPFECQFGLSVDEVRIAADWAFECGRYTVSSTPRAGGEPMNDARKYITIYQRQPDDRASRIARDIWNGDLPVPGTRERPSVRSTAPL